MKRILFSLALICSAAGAATLADLSGGQTGRIEFTSSSPEHRWALIKGRVGPAVTVYGDLLMPTGKSGKVPAVIFSHGSEGVYLNGRSLYFEVWAKELNAAGIAVFIVDSFTPRGVTNILGSEKQLAYDALMSNVADSLNALKLLSTHPQIDANRIFHMGWSRGGNAVLAAAYPSYQQHLLPAAMKWAGSIALYPGCNVRYRSEQHAKLKAPMLMLLGEKDDMTPAQPCVDYAKELATVNEPVTYKVYANAHHVFDRLNQAWGQSKQGSYRSCSMDIKMPSGANDNVWGPGFDKLTQKTLTQPKDFTDAIHSCETKIYNTSESNSKAREEAVKDATNFILANSAN